MFDKSQRVTEVVTKHRKLVVRPRSAGSGNTSRVLSPKLADDPKTVVEVELVNENGKLLIGPHCGEVVQFPLDASNHVGVKPSISPPKSPVHARPSTQPSGGVRKTLPTSSRLTKPPVPVLSSRARRTAAEGPVLSPEVVPEIPDHSSSIDPTYCSTPVVGQYQPYHPYSYMMPYQMPQMVPHLPNPPHGYYPIYPGTTLYGNIHHQEASSATVVYTSGPIPPNTTSIILVPMQPPAPQSVSETSFSNYGPDQPLVVFIERNIFKHWFDANMPNVLGELPRIKRFKSTETFMHWLTSKKKYLEMKLFVLVRVTEVSKLISELNKEFPQSVMNGRILKNVFAYEHLFSVSDQPGKSLKAVCEDLVRTHKFSVSHCLEDACKLALESFRNLN